MQKAEPSPTSLEWQVVHATVIGSTHLSSGIPCQDAAGWCMLPSGLLAVALADGAGSAKQAETGANLAVAKALASLGNSNISENPQDLNTWSAAIQQAFLEAREILVEEAIGVGAPPNEYATTLTCLVASNRYAAVGQVGDGAIIARTTAGELQILAQPQRGEYANETSFITMPDALEHGFYQVVEVEVAGLVLMSDGLIRMALQLPGYTPHVPFFKPLWTFAAGANMDEKANLQLAEFLASERVCARTDDDKSLVIAVIKGFGFQDNEAGTIALENEAEG
jgi:hypothetical protein